jgi:AcrR family transcriptional regulator
MRGLIAAVTDAGDERAGARRRILDAAVARIAREGIDDARIARIAMDAGVSPALVHYHFESREALLVEALEHSYEIAGDTRTNDPDDSAPAAERLRAIIDSCLPVPGAQRDDWLLWVELWLRAARHPELAEAATRLYGRLHEWVGDAIAFGVASGEFAPVDSDRLTDHLLALMDGYGLRVLIGDSAVDLDRARAEIWAVAAQQLGLEH